MLKLFPMLNAVHAGELEFWTEDELYSMAAEHLSRLARAGALFAERTEEENAAAGSAQAIDDDDLAVVAVGWNGVALRPATEEELTSRFDNWETLADSTPTHFCANVLGTANVRLVPPAAASATYEKITLQRPADVSSSSPEFAAPLPMEVWLRARVLAEARDRHGDGRMAEVAERMESFARLLETVIVDYYGAGM
jgi:hypothetical protein